MIGWRKIEQMAEDILNAEGYDLKRKDGDLMANANGWVNVTAFVQALHSSLKTEEKTRDRLESKGR